MKRDNDAAAVAVLYLFILFLFVVASLAQPARGDELLWRPDLHDEKFLAVMRAPSGALSVYIDPARTYQRAVDRGTDYYGNHTVTRYYEVFAAPIGNPARADGWRDRRARWLYTLPLFDAATPLRTMTVEVRTDGTNFLVVIEEKER